MVTGMARIARIAIDFPKSKLVRIDFKSQFWFSFHCAHPSNPSRPGCVPQKEALI